MKVKTNKLTVKTANALSLKARTPQAIVWNALYQSSANPLLIHAAEKSAIYAAHKRGIKAQTVSTGRPGTTAYTLSGKSSSGEVKCRMAGDGKVVKSYQHKGISYKSKAHYLICKEANKAKV